MKDFLITIAVSLLNIITVIILIEGIQTNNMVLIGIGTFGTSYNLIAGARY